MPSFFLFLGLEESDWDRNAVADSMVVVVLLRVDSDVFINEIDLGIRDMRDDPTADVTDGMHSSVVMAMPLPEYGLIGEGKDDAYKLSLEKLSDRGDTGNGGNIEGS
jgi:hypothetical protein